MKKLTLLLAVCLPLLSFGQFYKSGLGIKAGYPGFVGLNNKTFLNMRLALDNTLGVNFDRDNRFIQLQTLFEYNQSFGTMPGYNWYVGIGPRAMYFLNGGYTLNDGVTTYNGFILKADAAFGFEYTPPRTRLNLAIEAGPSVFVRPFFQFGGYGQVAVRYVIATGGFKRKVR
jgi:hypothetical protein